MPFPVVHIVVVRWWLNLVSKELLRKLEGDVVDHICFNFRAIVFGKGSRRLLCPTIQNHVKCL